MVAVTLLGGGLLTVGVFFLRLNAYYLVFLIPLLTTLVVGGGLGYPRNEGLVSQTPDKHPEQQGTAPLSSSFLFATGAALTLFVGLASAQQLSTRLQGGALTRRSHAFKKLGAFIKQRKTPRLVVSDPDCLHTILLYYAFPHPVETYQTCRFTNATPVRCRHKGWELRALTSMGSMETGWAREAVARLRRLQDRSFWYVKTERFPNPSLTKIIQRRCKKRGRWGPLTLFECPPSEGS